jgi:ribonuclease P protein component
VSATAPNGGVAPSAKFPRSGRLLRHADFERVYKQGRRHFSHHMTVFYLRREEGLGLRVGFTVGRVLGGAVDRNRMKRRLREAVRAEWPAYDFSVDVVVNPKKLLLKAGFDDIVKEVAAAFAVIQKKAAVPDQGRDRAPGK